MEDSGFRDVDRGIKKKDADKTVQVKELDVEMEKVETIPAPTQSGSVDQGTQPDVSIVTSGSDSITYYGRLESIGVHGSK